MNERIPPHIFRAYDIRGLYLEELTAPIMFEIGIAFGTYVSLELNGKEVVVGNDIRQSSVPLTYSFISGVISTGINVNYVGTTAFGQTLFAGWQLKPTATAFITASHLPPKWNGIKFYHSDGVGFSERELMKIRDIVLNADQKLVSWNEIGESSTTSIEEQYIQFFKEIYQFSNTLKVALDCGGGSTTLSAPKLFTSLGLDVVCLFCEPDPTFSGRPSDPKPKNLTKLVEVVKTNHCDFGVAFDGDGDRAVIIDNNGKILSADLIGILIGKYGLKEKSGTIVVNVECSKAVTEQLEPLGFTVKQIPVGHTFLTIEAKKENSPLGIESSGHIIIPEFFLFDDAIVTPLKIAEILNREKKKLSKLAEKVPVYPIEKAEIECNDDLKFKVVDILKKEIVEEYEDINTLDGVRINLEKGWILIRPSNTSPIIRMTIEADSLETIQSISKIFRSKLNEIITKIKN